MANMINTKTPMPEQPPMERVNNFKEVALGYDESEAKCEASRCLQCKHRPCVSGCPVNISIPEFIAQIEKGDYDKAYQIISQTNGLPAICGRVCPQESQCEAKCVRGIKGEPVAIGRLERFVADYAIKKCLSCEKPKENKNIKVAVIGSGPAGLTCAADLARLGYSVTIFEALHTPGGVLVYGIPEFRLPKALVNQEINNILGLGVALNTNEIIGKTITIDELLADGSNGSNSPNNPNGYEAIFIGSGAGLPNFQHIPGENLNGVYSANEFLTRVNLMKAYDYPKYHTPVTVGEKVAVIGGGNVAMDAARSAKRLGAKEVYIIYRRSEAEMPARLEEIHHAKEEGILMHLLVNSTGIIGDESGFVKGIKCIKMGLGELDASGRRSPIEIKGSEFILDVDTVIVAIGNSPNPLLLKTTPDLQATNRGCIIADEETGKTNKEGVWAGGDAVTGAATVILAMGAGKKAAKSIDAYLCEKHEQTQ